MNDPFAVVSLACGAPGGDGEGADPGASEDPAATRPRPSEADTLRLRLDVPGAVRTGEPVLIRLHVQNVSGRPLELHLRGREIAFDLAVRDADGETVWRRLEGAVIPGILRLEPLAPGDSLVLSHSWDQRSNDGEAVPPGAYIVAGEVLTDGEPLTASGVPLGITGPQPR